MPSNKKMLPKERKRVTASARARISVRKAKKGKQSDFDGSYLEKAGGNTVSTVTNWQQSETSVPSNNDAVLLMLQEIKDSNAALAHRMDKVEQSVTRDTTPLNPRSHIPDPLLHSSQLASPTPNLHQIEGVDAGSDPVGMPGPSQDRGQATLASHSHVHSPQHRPSNSQGSQAAHMKAHMNSHLHQDRRDAVIPSLQALRSNPTVSEAVTNLLATYEARAHSDITQGKQKRSGRYNTHDMITVQPHLRWPNEGFHDSNGKKRLTYDELSLPQWVAGQLTNIHAMSDPTQVKQAILQMTLAMRDAVSLPWPAVRTAWASSMHQVEEGNLSWAESTQWAINRLSASQIAMAHSQAQILTSVAKRPCRYFNESTCSHESHHGAYSHICSYCHRQGKQFNHPETKCNHKHKTNSRAQQPSI